MHMLQLERECRSYTRYLIGQAPSPYVIAKYRDFHQRIGFDEGGEGPFDRLLLPVSARGPVWARLADSYASVWYKNSSVRRKLVLTLALLECSPPSFDMLDRCPSRGPAGAALRLTFGAAVYACSLFAGIIVFAPVHLWTKVRGH
jgi:hypothetical protein